MGKSSPPPAPDYRGAAIEQGAANVEAARVQGKFNNPNVVSPYGTQTTTYGSGFNEQGYQDAMTQYRNQLAQRNNASSGPFFRSLGSRLGPPPVEPSRRDYFLGDPDQPTFTQKFSPTQQALYDQQVKSQQMLGGLGQQGITAASDVIGRDVDYSGAPGMPGSSEDIRNQTYDAMMQRPNEDIAVQRDNANSQMIAAGIRPGTPAYDNAMRQIDRQQNDARNQAVIAGGVEAQRNYGMDLGSRQQGLTEYNAQRSIPLNEITALLSGSQVSNPFQMPGYAQNASVAPAPIYAATNAAGQYGTDVWNAKQAQNANLQSGLFQLGGAGLMGGGMAWSDRRLKSQIVRIGTHPLGIGIYDYRIDGKPARGVMAQDVLTVRPHAVHRHASGYLMVDYGGLN